MTEKQYGLILSSKGRAKADAQPKRSIFDDDSDDESVPDWMKSKGPSKKTANAKSMQQKQAQQVIKQALKDDPSVYEYDEVYDKMVKEKEESKILKHSDKSSKYIEQLVKAADRRKMENEERNERKVQKEREQEGDEFQDKEEFVTGAYRKKMEELQLARDELQRKDHIDELTDVTKQKDLSGFYRHLYREANPESSKVTESTTVSKFKESKDNIKIPDDKDQSDSDSGRRSVSPGQNRPRGKKRSASPPPKPVRHRSQSKEKSRSRSRSRDRHHRRSHKDKHRRTEHRHRRSRSRDNKHRDSHRYSHRDRSRDRYSERSHHERSSRNDRREDERSIKPSHRDHEREHKYDKKVESSGSSRGRKRSVSPVLSQRTEIDNNKINKPVEVKEEKEEVEKKPSVWAKRTVGAVFEDAVERYLRRKAVNSSRPAIVVED